MLWDPDRYLTYAGHRGRPFVDLLAQVGASAPRIVVDLGCGPGNLTRLLTERWPDARVHGVDSSPEMVDRARAAGIDAELGDVRGWTAHEAVDVLVAHAVLQWVPGHLDLLAGLVAQVAPGGWFAFQVPGNFGEPSHAIRAEIAARAPYADHVRDIEVPSSHDPATYLRTLQDLGCHADVWETTYLHVLHGEDPVFAWVSGTGARPTLQALPDDLRPAFAGELRARLREAYPDDGHGVVLPFRRVFAVAQVPA